MNFEKKLRPYWTLVLVKFFTTQKASKYDNVFYIHT